MLNTGLPDDGLGIENLGGTFNALISVYGYGLGIYLGIQ